MLKIKKDNVEMVVTSGAYDNLYKGMGYEVVEEPKVVKEAAPAKEVAPVEPAPTEDKKAFTKPADKKVEKAEK